MIVLLKELDHNLVAKGFSKLMGLMELDVEYLARKLTRALPN